MDTSLKIDVVLKTDSNGPTRYQGKRVHAQLWITDAAERPVAVHGELLNRETGVQKVRLRIGDVAEDQVEVEVIK